MKSCSSRLMLLAAILVFAHQPLGAQATTHKDVPTTVTVAAVTNFVSASAFTRLNLKDLVTGISYVYFVTTVTTQANTPYQIQARLGEAYAYPPVQARLWDGTGTYLDITTTVSQVVAKGSPRASQSDEVRFRVTVPKGKKPESLPNPTIVYVIAPQ